MKATLKIKWDAVGPILVAEGDGVSRKESRVAFLHIPAFTLVFGCEPGARKDRAISVPAEELVWLRPSPSEIEAGREWEIENWKPISV